VRLYSLFKRLSNKMNNASETTIVAPFEAFENRMLKVIDKLSKQDIVLDFNREQLETLYNQVLSVVETSIFAEMEEIMNAIRCSLKVVIAMRGGSKSFNSFMDNQDYFKQFTTHVVTSYQSLQEQRIDILMTHNSEYQGMEDELFGEVFINENGFEKAFDIHLNMIQAFHDHYHELLLEGVLLDKDDKIETSVIEPVVQRYKKKIQVGGAVE